jgi:hypothetical protein
MHWRQQFRQDDKSNDADSQHSQKQDGQGKWIERFHVRSDIETKCRGVNRKAAGRDSFSQ